MEVRLTPDQQAFIRDAIGSGLIKCEEDAILEALALWEERERKRTEFLVTLDDARASVAKDGGRLITEQSMRELAGEMKRRGLARLAAE